MVVKGKKSGAAVLKVASFEDMVTKPRRVADFKFVIGTTDTFIKFRALPSEDYDDLLSEHPPTKQQRADGMTFNTDTFFPVLVSTCSVEPELTKAEVEKIISSEAWSFGELNSLYSTVLNLNTFGAGASFT